MATKKQLINDISKKYTKEELKNKCKKYFDTKSIKTKKQIKTKLGKLKKDELEQLLSDEKTITISLKPSKWMIPVAGLAVIIIIIGITSAMSGQGTTKGVLTLLTDSGCGECFDISINEQIMSNYGFDFTTETVDISSTEGISLINKYYITKIPAFILSNVGDVTSNTEFLQVWATVGTIENDGSLVFRAPEVFSSLGTHKILNDNGSFELYEPPKEALGSFLLTEDEVCTEGGKPVIYFFGSITCPHCQWEHPIIENVTNSFGDEIVYKDNMESMDDIEVFMDYSSINSGAVPFTVLGCKYVKLGSGESIIFNNETINELNSTYPSKIASAIALRSEANVYETQILAAQTANDTELMNDLLVNYSAIVTEASIIVEKLVITELICNLTNNDPASVCE